MSEKNHDGNLEQGFWNGKLKYWLFAAVLVEVIVMIIFIYSKLS